MGHYRHVATTTGYFSTQYGCSNTIYESRAFHLSSVTLSLHWPRGGLRLITLSSLPPSLPTECFRQGRAHETTIRVNLRYFNQMRDQRRRETSQPFLSSSPTHMALIETHTYTKNKTHTCTPSSLLSVSVMWTSESSTWIQACHSVMLHNR